MELKETIENMGKSYDAFKADNDARLKQLESKGTVDPLLAEKVDKINAEVTKFAEMKYQIEALEKAIARSQYPSGEGSVEVNTAVKEHKAAFEKWFRKGGEGNLEAVKQLQVKAGLSTLSDPDGGFLVAPPEFDTAIDRVAASLSAMRRISTVRTIGTDTYKKLVSQGGSNSGWVAERGSRTETGTPTLSEIAINTKEIYAEPGATQKSLDDATLDLASWLADEVSIDFAEEEGESFITGDGVSKPHGIAGYTMVADGSYAWGKVGYTVSGHATLLNSADKLIDVVTSLKSIYLNGASWLMNRSTMGKIRQLKDGDGNYIWRPGLEQGAPNTLLGYPVDTDDNIANIGAGAYPLFFANFKRAYLILDRMGIQILRDPYTSKGNVLFYTTKRVGGGITMFEAIKALKISA